MAIARFLELYVFGPSGFWTMAPLSYSAKFDPFLSLDCAPTPSTLAQSKEGRDQILPSGNLAFSSHSIVSGSARSMSRPTTLLELTFLAGFHVVVQKSRMEEAATTAPEELRTLPPRKPVKSVSVPNRGLRTKGQLTCRPLAIRSIKLLSDVKVQEKPFTLVATVVPFYFRQRTFYRQS